VAVVSTADIFTMIIVGFKIHNDHLRHDEIVN
jgi:hypothetical protein